MPDNGRNEELNAVESACLMVREVYPGSVPREELRGRKTLEAWEGGFGLAGGVKKRRRTLVLDYSLENTSVIRGPGCQRLYEGKDNDGARGVSGERLRDSFAATRLWMGWA